MEHFSTLGDVTARRESGLRARALTARAIGKALDPGVDAWVSHVARVCGSAMADELRQKGTVPAATMGNSQWAGALTSERLFSSAFLELVTPGEVPSRLLSMGAVRAPMNTRIPADTLDDDPQFTWVGENTPVPAAKFSFEQLALPPAKIGAIAAFTREQARLVEMHPIIERRLVRGNVRGVNVNFLDPSVAAVANQNPASITFGAPSFSSGSTGADIEDDLSDALASLSGGLPLRPVVVMGPSMAIYLATLRTNGTRYFPDVTVSGGTVLGVPVIAAREAFNLIVAIDAAGIAVADGGIEIDTAQQASLQLTDTPSAGPTNLVSLFQANAIALKTLRWISWAKRDDAVAYVDLAFGSGGSPIE
jgi:hypothetical protein